MPSGLGSARTIALGVGGLAEGTRVGRNILGPAIPQGKEPRGRCNRWPTKGQKEGRRPCCGFHRRRNHALDRSMPEKEKKLAATSTELLISSPDHGEEGGKSATRWCGSGAVDVLVIDSVCGADFLFFCSGTGKAETRRRDGALRGRSGSRGARQALRKLFPARCNKSKTQWGSSIQPAIREKMA